VGAGRHRYDLIVAALRARLRSGDAPPGAMLNIQALSEELQTSPTPVREALAYLAGAGVVEARPGLGYVAAEADPDTVRSLYELHGLLVDASLGSDAPGPWVRTEPGISEDPVELAEALFGQIVRESGRPAWFAWMARLADRLAPLRRIELVALPGLEADLRELMRLHRAGERSALRAACAAHHLRRIEAAGRLSAHLRAAQSYRPI
jgi:hypothetical protein